MTDEEHVALLKQGVMAWNKWRKTNPVKPDPTCGAPGRGGSDSGEPDLAPAQRLP
jgi:hypothetical protein